MDSEGVLGTAVRTGKCGARAVKAGVDAAGGKIAEVARNIPYIGGLTAPKDGEVSDKTARVTVEELSDDSLKRYMAVLIWLVHIDDRRIDEKELCEIQLMMTRMQCGANIRTAVREHLERPQSLDPRELIDELLHDRRDETEEAKLALKCALMKDAIRVRRATSGGSVRDEAGIRQLARILELDDAKVEFLEDACEQDENILAGELSDKQIVGLAKDMTARAAAVGAPVTAIYVAGSVGGLSAAGITSGLATLGMGGVLGLSAMVSGIGVAVIVGGVVYMGVRWALGGSERHWASLRELMLQEVLLTHQRAIVDLGEDMSRLGTRIAKLADETDRNRDAIGWLKDQVALLSRSAGALGELGRRSNRFESDLQKAAGSKAAGSSE
ncbi:MAG: hypothetical protein OXG58_07280 [Gemmatimonadetes bacterium]|nr:hypothetical protein [Gemmatimonadota bacterium]MCY3942521.1 hypothetical protein [Gemmatimonadota bacterium]